MAIADSVVGALGAGSGIVGSLIRGKTRVQFIQNNSTVIQIDASLKEDHVRDSPPTEFPVENGDTISDHIILKPFQLTINGIITDTPLNPSLLSAFANSAVASLIPPVGLAVASAGVALLSATTKSDSPSVAAYQQLLALQENAKPFDVLTSLYRYPNMWMKSISAPRDSGTGDSLIFTVQLVQLLLVTPQSISVQIFADAGLAGGISNQGQQSTDLPNGFTPGLNKFNSLKDAALSKLPKGLGG